MRRQWAARETVIAVHAAQMVVVAIAAGEYHSLAIGEVAVVSDGPVELLLDLMVDITDLQLRKGIENSLLVKLDTALEKLEDGNGNNDAAAVNLLEAFINAVQAQRGKKIPEAVADTLIADAERIIELLNNE